MEFKIGDSVRVKKGSVDPDTNTDMSGWQGRITEFYPQYGTALVAFDSITIRNLPPKYVAVSEEEGMSWDSYNYELKELELVDERDKSTDVKAAVSKVSSQHAYDHLGKEGRAISMILKGSLGDEITELYAWESYLSDMLQMPFDAMVDESHEMGPIQMGDRIRVRRIEMADEMYGIIMNVRKGRRVYHVPLADMAVSKSSSNAQIIQLYRVWYANR